MYAVAHSDLIEDALEVVTKVRHTLQTSSLRDRAEPCGCTTEVHDPVIALEGTRFDRRARGKIWATLRELEFDGLVVQAELPAVSVHALQGFRAGRARGRVVFLAESGAGVEGRCRVSSYG